MGTTNGVDEFGSEDYALTAWNIDEVAADIMEQAAKKCPPVNESKAAYDAKSWIIDDYEYILNERLVRTADELINNTKNVKSDHAQSFLETNNSQNDFDNTNADRRFHWYSLVLFYDKLLNEGYKVKKTEPNQVSTSIINIDNEHVQWVIEQLEHHPDSTSIAELKETIEVKLARRSLSPDETSAFLKSHLNNAENEFESCYSSSKVAKSSKEKLARSIVEAVVNHLVVSFTDEKAKRILLNFGKAWVWNEFVNWLVQKREPYVPIDPSIYHGRPKQEDKDEGLIPAKYIIGDEVKREDIPSPNKQEELYYTFESLFYNPRNIDECVKALRDYWPDKPIVSNITTRRWQKIDGSKKVLAAWIRRMEDCNMIKFLKDKKQLVPLLEAYFPDLILGKDARTLTNIDFDIVQEFSAVIIA